MAGLFLFSPALDLQHHYHAQNHPDHEDQRPHHESPAIQHFVSRASDVFTTSAACGPFWTLHDLKLYAVSLIQSFESVLYNRAVMYKNIRAVLTPDEPISLGIVKPLDRAFHVPVLCFPGTLVLESFLVL